MRKINTYFPYILIIYKQKIINLPINLLNSLFVSPIKLIYRREFVFNKCKLQYPISQYKPSLYCISPVVIFLNVNSL